MSMASTIKLPIISLVPVSLVAFLCCHPVLSFPCKSLQKFSTKKTAFTNCGVLPYHNATLHWTYDRPTSSLSMAFVAPPPTPDGWVAWAINPSGTGMVGAQALVAFKQRNGSMEVKPFNIHSYHSVKEGPLSLNVSDVSAEYDDDSGNMVILGTWALPEKTAGTLNQVWQVGPSVVKGRPLKHEFDDDSLASKGKLHLLEKDQSSEGDGGSGSAEPPEAVFGNPNGSLPLFSQGKNDAGISKMRCNILGVGGLVASIAFALFF
ncbi:hypothetical protein Dimus_032163 [Dionaea muscipula]